MPLLLLLPFILELLSLGFVILDIHFFYAWYTWKDTYRHDYAMHCLYAAMALAAYSLGGSWPLRMLLSNGIRTGFEPKEEHSGHREMLKRPDGTAISIEIFGDALATPVLMVHGWMANSTEWYYQRKYFSQSHRVIVIDLPGLGRSVGPDNEDYSLQKMAGDLGAVLEHLDLKDVILWGHSIGGMVILTYCTQVGKDVEKRVRGLVLQHTTFTNPVYTGMLSGLLKAIEKPVLYPLCYLMIGLSPLFWFNKWISYFNGHSHISTRLLSFTGTQSSKQLDFITRLSAHASPAVTARGMLAMMKTYDVTDSLKYLKIPALIVTADHDRLTRPVAGRYMHQNILGSELITLSPAGHQGLMERHADTNRMVSKFVNSLDVESHHELHKS